MARTTRRLNDFLPQGFSIEDLEIAKWFSDFVAQLYHGVLHSHAAVIPVPYRRGRRGPTSLSALFHAQWPRVQLVDILTALAKVGFITPPQKTAGLVANEKSCRYSFRLACDLGQLALRGGSAKPRAGRKDRGAGQSLQRKFG
jgi:hypothetical protein